MREVRGCSSWSGRRSALCLAVFLAALLLPGASKAQDASQIFRQFMEVMKEVQRQEQLKRAERERQREPTLPNTAAPQVPYKVGGLELGQTIDRSSDQFKSYKCTPSEVYKQFTRCAVVEPKVEARGRYNQTSVFLASSDGKVFYTNQTLVPAFWREGEMNDDIQKIIRHFGVPPRILDMPEHNDLPKGIIASWGNVVLEPLDKASLKILASGASLNTGILADFQNDYAVSAKNGLPVYRVTGGSGYVWVATVGENAKGTLRFFAIDPSALVAPQTSLPPVASVQASERRVAEAEAQTERAERKASVAETAKQDAERNAKAAEAAKQDAERKTSAAENAKQNAERRAIEAVAFRQAAERRAQEAETEKQAALRKVTEVETESRIAADTATRREAEIEKAKQVAVAVAEKKADEAEERKRGAIEVAAKRVSELNGLLEHERLLRTIASGAVAFLTFICVGLLVVAGRRYPAKKGALSIPNTDLEATNPLPGAAFARKNVIIVASAAVAGALVGTLYVAYEQHPIANERPRCCPSC
jgi:flagellar biosynthesis GTPase FlhF